MDLSVKYIRIFALCKGDNEMSIQLGNVILNTQHITPLVNNTTTSVFVD